MALNVSNSQAKLLVIHA